MVVSENTVRLMIHGFDAMLGCAEKWRNEVVCKGVEPLLELGIERRFTVGVGCSRRRCMVEEFGRVCFVVRMPWLVVTTEG